MLIVPAILAYSEKEFRERIGNADLRALTTLWQVDILDGTLFENTSWSNLEAFSAHFSLPEIELHLMVSDPLSFAHAWKARIPSVKRAIVHAEIPTSIEYVLNDLRDLGIETGLAVNPETPLDSIAPHEQLIDVILILGVHPGYSGRTFLGEQILEKIRDAKKRFPNNIIAVDGGVTLENALSIKMAGADQLCIASALWKSENPVQTMRTFMSL